MLTPILPGPAGQNGLDGVDGQNGLDGVDGQNGLDGSSAYAYIAYASDASGTGFSLTASEGLKYLAVLTTDTEIVSPAVGDFAGLWVKYIGEDGTNGTNGTNGQDGEDGEDGDSLAISSFSDATGALDVIPTFYAATVGSSYSKALPAAASCPEGMTIEIRIVSLTGTSMLTIVPDGGEPIRHCGAVVSNMILVRLGAELRLRKRDAGWDVVRVRGRQAQRVRLTTPGSGGASHGTSSTKVKRFTVTEEQSGTAIVPTDSSTLGTILTLAEFGDYAIERADQYSVSANACGVSVNASGAQLTTDIASISYANRLLLVGLPGAGLNNAGATVYRGKVSDTLRAHDRTTNTNGTADSHYLLVTKLGED